MDYEKEIPFGAFDSELMHQEIYIPEGFKAVIKGNKIILEKTESKDEKIRKLIRGWINTRPASFFDNGISKEEMLVWIEKQDKPKWTKEDKDNLNMAIYFMRSENTPYSPTDVEPVVEWLCGLKQRMEE